ncbi:Outer membrane protein Omp28 [anaerobic digester metagenome]
MKHVLSFALLLGFGMSLNAQTIVSTTADNKKVVLEEFTGANCTYCPDGHKIANQLMDANPGEFFAINVHQGSFAPTSPASINYTTTYGNSLGTQAGAASIGWPCGTINRHQYTGSVLAMGRGSWGTYTTTALAQSSPVNIAIDVDLDYATREMTVLVEVYYTATSSASTNNLNVAILQDWVKGPQVGSSANPTYVTSDGQYWHMHMFRDFITGQWGITIPQTTIGTFWDSTFVFNVPASYGAIPVELPNLKVVAFVAEGQTEILTADEAAVPPAPIDASVSAIAGFPTSYCSSSFTPAVTIMNKGANALTSCDIDYSLDGGATQTYNWTGSIATGVTTVVNLPSQTITTSGSHSFTAATNNPNAGTDYNTVNDSYAESFTAFVGSGSAPVTEAFTSTVFPPAGFASDDFGGDGKNWARSTSGHSAAGSAYANFYSISSGQKDDLFIIPLDFSSATSMGLSFYVAYRQYSTENDKLQVDVSTDCGTTWSTKWNKSGTTLATGAATTSSFTPTAAEWRQEIVDLSSYAGQSEVLIRFRATSAYGNNLYVDDINLSPTAAISENEIGSAISVYPNPANDLTTVSVNSASSVNAVVTVVNTLGEVVFNSSTWLNNGLNNLNINTENLDNGVYYISVQTTEGVMNSTFVVGR